MFLASVADVATISELYHYPVKSCAGVRLRSGVLGMAGLGYDRRFLVTDLAGTYRSQRRDPLLATVQPTIEDGLLTLSAPGAGTLEVAVDDTGPRRPVSLFGEPYTGIDQGEDVAAWFTAVLGRPSRLVLAPPEHHRVTGGRTTGTSAYADSCAVHVLSSASLRELNDRIDGPPVPMSRFRPNVVVDGWDAHEEDRVRYLTAGTAELAYAKPAIRCAITMVDQLTGTRAGPEPLRTLATYRRADGGVAFGAKYAVVRPGLLSVGDVLTQSSRPSRRAMATASSFERAPSFSRTR